MKRRSVAVPLGLLLVAAGCAKLAGLEPVAYEDELPDGAPSDAGLHDAGKTDAPILDAQGPDADVPPDASADVTLPGPTMVPAGATGNAFAIDSTEVTFGQYRAFVAAVGADAGPLPKRCAGKTTFAPQQIGTDPEPVAGVDWCDARAYCAWAGKRMCGKVVDGGDPGTPLAVGEITSPVVAQFTIACSKAGQLTYPYGAAEKPGNCDVGDGGVGHRVPVATYPKCVGGYPGIHDMVGNVFEWIDVCFPQDAGVDYCIIQGGSYMTVESSDCTKAFSATVDFQAPDVGFRCCSR